MKYFKGMFAWDLSGLSPDHADVVKGALKACDYPFGRIRRSTGKKVPVTVADLSRWNRTVAVQNHYPSDTLVLAVAVHGEDVHVLAGYRQQAYGLYWLPTDEHPAGRVELSDKIMGSTALAQEVFLAEAAHAVDYGSLTDLERVRIFAIVHGGDSNPHGTHGWWEERGGQDYWADWVGEAFMGLFMRAFAPSLTRPMENNQPWEHRLTDDMALQVRRYLKKKVRL